MSKVGQEELRRAARVRVCCRVDVRQPHGVWTGVTKDLSARGCRIVSAQQPRLGARVRLTLSSDLFPEELSTPGEVVWVSGAELGILFVEEAKRKGALSSDLFPEELSTPGEVVWVSGEQLGILFLDEARRRGTLSPSEWLRRVLHHGQDEDVAAAAAVQPPERVVPVVTAVAHGGNAIPIRSRRRSG